MDIKKYLSCHHLVMKLAGIFQNFRHGNFHWDFSSTVQFETGVSFPGSPSLRPTPPEGMGSSWEKT